MSIVLSAILFTCCCLWFACLDTARCSLCNRLNAAPQLSDKGFEVFPLVEQGVFLALDIDAEGETCDFFIDVLTVLFGEFHSFAFYELL